MRDRGAAARADIDLAGASGYVQAPHALHLVAIPDLVERRIPDAAERLAVQHVALAARIHVAVMLDVHRPAPQVVAGVLPFLCLVPRLRPPQIGFPRLCPYLATTTAGLSQPVVLLPHAPAAPH